MSRSPRARAPLVVCVTRASMVRILIIPDREDTELGALAYSTILVITIFNTTSSVTASDIASISFTSA